jgi:hypothetical protein
MSYNDIAKRVSERTGKKYTAKAVDNALNRIKKKAQELKKKGKFEDIPLILK